jgi:hypothetical protein
MNTVTVPTADAGASTKRMNPGSTGSNVMFPHDDIDCAVQHTVSGQMSIRDVSYGVQTTPPQALPVGIPPAGMRPVSTPSVTPAGRQARITATSPSAA